MSGISVNVSTQVNINENRAVKVQVNNQVEVQQVVKYENDGYAKPEARRGRIPENINILSEESKTPEPPKQLEDSSLKVAKKVSAGVLLGGSVGAIANTLGRGIVEETLSRPTPTGIALGVSIGTGIALLNTDVSDKKVKLAKNTAGAVLLGAGTTGVVQAVAKSIFTDSIHSPSKAGVLLGASLAGGIAIANSDVGEGKTANLIKKTASGVMIGAGVSGMATGVAKSLFTSYLHAPSPTVVALGASIGAGIALANSEVDNKGLKVAKNALAGTLIAGGAVGVVSALGKTLSAEMLSGPSVTAMGIAAAVGAGIAIANTKE